MGRKIISHLRRLAAGQHGYFTTGEARLIGATDQALHSLLKFGTITRVSSGLYIVSDIPTSPLGPYYAASQWPDGKGVLSYETALDLLALSDSNPAAIHITVPRKYRTHRVLPKSYVLHRSNLEQSDIILVDSVRVTSARRAILDCIDAHIGADLLLQAIEQGFRKGHLNRQQVKDLKHRILW
jgi:predicted transcriptional regulator of viral defense system